MGQNNFFWNGVGWFQNLLDPDHRGRASASRARWCATSLFSLRGARHRGPARHRGVALHPEARLAGRRRAGADRPAAADPLQRRRRDLAALHPHRHRPARRRRSRRSAFPSTSRQDAAVGLVHHRRHGRLALDLHGGAAVLCRPEGDPGRLSTRRPGSTAPAAGRCSPTSNSRSCARCWSSPCCCASWAAS